MGCSLHGRHTALHCVDMASAPLGALRMKVLVHILWQMVTKGLVLAVWGLLLGQSNIKSHIIKSTNIFFK